MAKKALVFLADGFEEVEAITPIDYLRRSGVEVATVSISGDRTVTGSHNIPVIADTLLSGTALGNIAYDALLLPGGMPGASNLAASAALGALLKAQAASGRIVAAICASPAVALAPLGILEGKRFTCYPGMEDKVKGAAWSEDPVVIDGNIVTSRGAGTAAAWAVALIDLLLSPKEGEKIARSVLLQP
ncbi:MAG: DJ-1/PfpI family protein [Treponema sp.]|jgi:4-methyl-5(b-hydroxyethyl)-thiazole monophosphate biosynthesis|nr:DJ-1/PfpI family protein [Treponema sp.]